MKTKELYVVGLLDFTPAHDLIEHTEPIEPVVYWRAFTVTIASPVPSAKELNDLYQSLLFPLIYLCEELGVNTEEAHEKLDALRETYEAVLNERKRGQALSGDVSPHTKVLANASRSCFLWLDPEAQHKQIGPLDKVLKSAPVSEWDILLNTLYRQLIDGFFMFCDYEKIHPSFRGAGAPWFLNVDLTQSNDEIPLIGWKKTVLENAGEEIAK